MPNASDILWFKTQFQAPINAAVVGTPFDIDMLTAIACQETGHIWGKLRLSSMSLARILELCVGDTLDTPKRSAFPKNKAALVAEANGQAMFKIARDALVDMAKHIPGFLGASQNPVKFCHGFGLFQYDLQFFRVDPDYFLKRKYINFPDTLGKCLEELQSARKKIGFAGKPSLTDFEMACVAIAYNTGGFKPAKGLKQGFFDGTKFYGERFADFLALARSVAPMAAAAAIPKPPAGMANLSQPTPVSTEGTFYRVDTNAGLLRVRSTPKLAPGNIVGRLPDGHVVREIGDKVVNGFREIETSLAGAHIRGFASNDFLKKVTGSVSIPVVTPSPAASGAAVPAVLMPRRAGSVTTRTSPANAHSLNEAGQPGRKGTSPDKLRDELEAIVDHLAVDKASHKRYKPVGATTFCNIYAHDYCHLAGVYLPRVWWSGRALVAIARGQVIEPRLGDSINEVRANDLFRWLRDFGPDFGWRQTGTLTKLQDEVNSGAVGLIVARRTNDGKSGHIVAIVPESAQHLAKRDAVNQVVAPLQSQAGVVNFRRGTGNPKWWLGSQFAEHAFWIHA